MASSGSKAGKRTTEAVVAVAEDDKQSSSDNKSTAEPWLRVAACSYEGSLFGWNVIEDSERQGLDLEMAYGFNCCPSSLRAVAASQSGRYLACAGMDERIRLFDVLEKRAMGELCNHTGVINCLRFFGDTYLFSGSEESTVSIWRVYDGVCCHILGGHKGPIYDIAIHPSGKLGLTTSKDGTMKMWNLVHGRCAYTRRLNAPGDKILWESSAEYYLVASGSNVSVFVASDNSCKCEINYKSRVNQAVFTLLKQDPSSPSSEAVIRIAAVCENKNLYLHNLDGEKTAEVSLESLGGRPRDMSTCQISDFARDSLSSEDIKEALSDVFSVLTIITSNGCVAVVCVNSLEAFKSLEQSQIVSTAVKVEPRFIACVCWNNVQNYRSQSGGFSTEGFDESSASEGKLQKKRVMTSKDESDSEQQPEQEQEESNTAINKKKKDKKKDKKQLGPGGKGQASTNSSSDTDNSQKKKKKRVSFGGSK